MPEQKRLFISHTAEDDVFANRLAQLMKDRGALVSFDTDAAPGTFWPDALRGEIERATALVLLIPSRRATNRNNLLFEAGIAKTLGKPVLAVLPPSRRAASIELPTDIAGVLILDADRRPLDSIADTLLQAIPKDYAEVTAVK